MALKKDKQKVLGEVFDDERIKTFLNDETQGDNNPSFRLLEKAYRGMKAGNFNTFLGFFNNAGHDINAKNDDGESFLSIASQHRQGDEYVAALKAHGAQ